MATPLKIGFGSRQIGVQQVKMYLCTKFDAFVRICKFIPLTALTMRHIEAGGGQYFPLSFKHALISNDLVTRFLRPVVSMPQTERLSLHMPHSQEQI